MAKQPRTPSLAYDWRFSSPLPQYCPPKTLVRSAETITGALLLLFEWSMTYQRVNVTSPQLVDQHTFVVSNRDVKVDFGR